MTRVAGARVSADGVSAGTSLGSGVWCKVERKISLELLGLGGNGLAGIRLRVVFVIQTSNYRQSMRASALPVSVLIVSALPLPLALVRGGDVAYFEEKVRPLLAERCHGCHGAERQRGGLRLDSLEHFLAGGDAGDPVVRPGDVEGSLFLRAVRRETDEFAMPPKEAEALGAEEVAILEHWVAMGAPWPGYDAEAVERAMERSGERFSEGERGWWAFQPVVLPEVPAAGEGWAKNEIDRFVARRLEEVGLDPAAPAGRGEILRRVSYGLTGLPPTAEEVEHFLAAEDGDEAMAERVEELLGRVSYGERWAQHWLDLVRYAESDGYREDAVRPGAWRYRDYVVASFLEDKPYDRFMAEQVAGDEIAPDDPKVLVATGFLRHGIYEWNQRDAEGQWRGIVNEITDVTADVFLGMSVACAQCHDHKFDPILQLDYYRLRAFFAPIWWRDDKVLATPEELAEHGLAVLEWREKKGELLAEREALLEKGVARAREKATDMFPPEVQEMIRKAPGDRTPYEQQIALLCERQLEREEAKVGGALKDEAGQRFREIEEVLKEGKPADLPLGLVATDVGGEAPENILVRRGQAEDVLPGFLTILVGDGLATVAGSAADSTGRRSVLANWLGDPGNPLTARVIVNRVWQYHFGQGLVTTASDFGTLGSLPSHPELLDWLAYQFVHEMGWRLKDLHRLILASATYQQTARREAPEVARLEDPEGRLLWRFPPRRLDAAEIRDSILMVSGGLDSKVGGAPVGGTASRRSLYVQKRRNSPDSFLGQFDEPTGFGSMPARNMTTTPTQALTLTNSEWMAARSAALAKRFAGVKDEGERLEALWRAVYGEKPEEAERAAALRFLEGQRAILLAEAEAIRERGGGGEGGWVESGDIFPVGADLVGAKSLRLEPEEAPVEVKVLEGAHEPARSLMVEAVIRLESLYADSTVRTIVSRWNGETSSLKPESRGWSLGVTSTKSRYEPNNLILQVVGEDFQDNLSYEVVASGLRVPLGVPVYVGVEFEARAAGEDPAVARARFVMRDLSDPGAEIREVVVEHGVVSGIEHKGRALVIGGRKSGDRHLFHGEIGRVRVAGWDRQPTLGGQAFGGGVEVIADLRFGDGEHDAVEIVDLKKAVVAEPDELSAWADLGLVLLSSNRFLYLH